MTRKLPKASSSRDRQDPLPGRLRGIWRFLAWLPDHEVAFVLIGGLAFALVTIAGNALGVFDSFGVFLHVLTLFWVVGIFLFVVLVTDANAKYAKSRTLIRIACGAMAGLVIAMLLSAPMIGIALGVLAGAILGYFGPDWVYAL